FLESACFSPDYVRKTSMTHGLKTDASFRFERGTDPEIVVSALKKAAVLILEAAGGEISSEILDSYVRPAENTEIKTSYNRIEKLIGKKIPKDIINNILENLDIVKISDLDDKLSLSVPPYRVDVKREADIIEEIIRIYGYDNIEISDRLSSSYVAEFPPKDKDKTFKDLSILLVANGFNEIITNSLTKPHYVDKSNSVEILNKLSEDLGVLRQSLLFSGLEVIAYNVNRRQKDLKLFELGKVYKKEGEAYKESNYLSLFITGGKRQESWSESGENVDFYDLKVFIEMLFNKTGIADFKVEDADGIFSFGVNYSVNNRLIASYGKVQDKILKKTDIKQAVYYAEIDFDSLMRMMDTSLVYQEVSKFPEVRRDLSLVLDKKVSFGEIESIARKFEKRLLQDINVFDIYEGENLGDNKKSYSVSFILQDYEQTLTDKVIDKTMDKLMSAFEKELGAVIRK
ncbi:MAG: phenylalanine--tRNA ligase subunit beta, partial [Cytophagaceae bacterium]